MIHSISIRDKNTAPLSHVRGGFRFKKIKFKPGVNVLVGKNGSGKSTVLNLLRMYTFCDGDFESVMQPNKLLDGKKGSFYNITKCLLKDAFYGGVDVVADYSIKTFNLCEGDAYISSDEYSRDRLFARMERNAKSAGEERVFFFDMMCGKMFGDKLGFQINLNYCPSDAREAAKAYYDRNHKAGKPMPTIIMDEPDRNLDVYNAGMICEILGDGQRDDTQVIASLHNIGVISRLMKCGKVNFIELTDGYLDDVAKFMA